MRVVVIDDEADQASINTVKMGDAKNEDDIERTAVNQLIIDLVNGSDCEGNKATTQFQAMNYVSFTATPYANVLNEAYRDSLYPKNFICSLPESKEYFGIKAIWGSKIDENYSGLNIIRTIDNSEIKEIKELHDMPKAVPEYHDGESISAVIRQTAGADSAFDPELDPARRNSCSLPSP